MSETRIPSLDGLRAISIIFVVIAHLYGFKGVPFEWFYIGGILPLGLLGVRMFFVISGFLITTLLLREIAKSGRIHLGAFFLRRAFRIFPAYFFYLGVIAILSMAGVYRLHPVDFVPALTFTVNYHVINHWVLGHAWSLSVEEQFYLLWPATLLLVGSRRGFKIAIGLLFVAPLVRTVYFVAQPADLNVPFVFEANCDALAAGCLLARFRNHLWDQTIYRRYLESRWMVAVPLILVAAGALGGGYAKYFNPNMLHELSRSLGTRVPTLLKLFYELFGISVMNLCIAVCIDWCIRFRDGGLGRLLNCEVVTQVGVMSYSIYLWQQPFLNVYDQRTFTSYPTNILLTLLVATFSYYVVERPMLRARVHVESRIRRILSRRPVTAGSGTAGSGTAGTGHSGL